MNNTNNDILNKKLLFINYMYNDDSSEALLIINNMQLLFTV